MVLSVIVIRGYIIKQFFSLHSRYNYISSQGCNVVQLIEIT